MYKRLVGLHVTMKKELVKFKNKTETNLAMDHGDELVYIAPTRVNLQMATEKWPNIEFRATREHSTMTE